MSNTPRDYTGQVFGGWTVLRRHPGKKWVCVCHCGKEAAVWATNLVKIPAGCGCTSPGKRKPGSFLRSLLYITKRAAIERNHEFSLTEQEFETLVQKDCTYCGSPPVLKPTVLKSIKSDRVNTNGIDRVDNKLGYVTGNCVPCCTVCNRMKHALTLSEFLSHIARIYAFSDVA